MNTDKKKTLIMLYIKYIYISIFKLLQYNLGFYL